MCLKNYEQNVEREVVGPVGMTNWETDESEKVDHLAEGPADDESQTHGH